jgi:Cdc6-like AAA superfamily ATPase
MQAGTQRAGFDERFANRVESKLRRREGGAIPLPNYTHNQVRTALTEPVPVIAVIVTVFDAVL